jgi:TonB family protein
VTRSLALALLMACGGRGTATVTIPPGPELGPEPSAPPELFGRAWLETVLPAFRERWTASFLEDARLRLPADHPLNDPRLEVTLRLRVDAEGNVSELVADPPSPVPAFDTAALEVVRETTPLPPPPEELRSDDGYVHLHWRFARDARREGLTGVRVTRVEYDLGRAIPELMARRRFPEAARRLRAALGRGEAVDPQLRALGGGALLDAVADGEVDRDTRVEAARAILELRWAEGGAWLTAHQRQLPVEVQALLAKAPPIDPAPLLAVLADRTASRSTRAEAARILGRVDDPAVRQALTAGLGDREGSVRAACAFSLAQLGPPAKLFYPSLPLLGDRDPAVRGAAVLLVARADPRRALVEIPVRCRRERDRSVLVACAAALAALPEAQPELVRLTRVGDPAVARAAWEGLATRRDPLVGEQTAHPDPVVRVLAMQRSQDAERLIAGLADVELAVKWGALRGLLRVDRARGLDEALRLLASSSTPDERWWIGATLLALR